MSEPAASAADPAPPPGARGRGRAIVVWIAVVLAGVLLLLTSFAVWVNRVALNTDVFVDTSSELIQDDEIRSAVATRAVDELFVAVDVQAELEQQLPPDYQRLSGPASAVAREAGYRVVDRALERPALQRLWAASLEQSHHTLVAVLEGGGDTVSTEEGVVMLDLEPIILDAADRIGFREQVQENLPEDVGRIEVMRSDQLDAAQAATQLLKVLAWVLPILTLAAFGVAVWLSRDRRRVVRRIGLTLVVVGIVGLVAVGVVGNYVVDSLVQETDVQGAASNAWDILTELLRSTFWWLIPIGILFVVASWLAGPGSQAVEARRFLAPVLRERVWPYVALSVVGLALLLTGPVSDFSRYLVVALLVALGAVWIELTRRQTAAEFPGVDGGAMVDEMRSKLSGWWESTKKPAQPAAAPPPPAAPGSDLTTQLASLSELHAGGALTDDEYATAKARVLAGS